MDVSAILARKGSEVVTTPPTSTIGDVVAILADKGIGVVIVSSDGVTVQGVLSERDIVRALAARGLETMSLAAADLMSRKVFSCEPKDRIADLMARMTEQRIRHLPVIADGRLSGIVSIGDIVKHRLAEIEDEAEALRQYVAQA